MKKIADALGWEYMPGFHKYAALTPNGHIRIEARCLKFFDSIPVNTIPMCLDHKGFLKYVSESDTYLSIHLYQFNHVVLPYLAKRLELYE